MQTWPTAQPATTASTEGAKILLASTIWIRQLMGQSRVAHLDSNGTRQQTAGFSKEQRHRYTTEARQCSVAWLSPDSNTGQSFVKRMNPITFIRQGSLPDAPDATRRRIEHKHRAKHRAKHCRHNCRHSTMHHIALKTPLARNRRAGPHRAGTRAISLNEPGLGTWAA